MLPREDRLAVQRQLPLCIQHPAIFICIVFRVLDSADAVRVISYLPYILIIFSLDTLPSYSISVFLPSHKSFNISQHVRAMTSLMQFNISKMQRLHFHKHCFFMSIRHVMTYPSEDIINVFSPTSPFLLAHNFIK